MGQVSKLVMLAGNYFALNTASSLTAKCLQTKPSGEVTTHSTPSSPKPVQANTCLALCSSTSSLPSSTKSEPVPTDSSTTQSSSSPVRKTQRTTSQEDTTPSERKSSTSSSTDSESSLTSAPVSKAS